MIKKLKYLPLILHHIRRHSHIQFPSELSHALQQRLYLIHYTLIDVFLYYFFSSDN